MRNALVLATALVGCGPAITEMTMMKVEAREPTCSLELVQVDASAFSFNQTWDLLGYVTLVDHKSPDPISDENRALVRPRACAMGGTQIAITMSSAAAGGGSLAYMVLRPKAALATPSSF